MRDKYYALIVDDDPIFVEQLTGFLIQTELFMSPHVCLTSTQAITALREQTFDIIFLDIVLPDMSALDLLQLMPKGKPICAVSAHPTYAVNCYDLEVDDFIAKPLTYARLVRSINRILLKTPAQRELTQETLSAAAKPSAAMLANYIYLKTGRQVDRFLIEDIIYLEAFHIYSKVITCSDSTVVNERISRLEERLTHCNFIRIHRSYLVNLSHVTQYTTNTIWLGNTKLPVGNVFKDKLQEHLKILTNL